MRHLCDSNVWLALVVMSHPHHIKARSWAETLPHTDRLVFSRATQQSFLRLLTTEAWMKEETQTNANALKILRELQINPLVEVLLPEPEGLEKIWWKLAGLPEKSPKIWMDAYLSSFAISQRLRFVTFDKGFRRYVKNGLDLLLLGD
jgi:toxin-antitoxin system PIN domain toxin